MVSKTRMANERRRKRHKGFFAALPVELMEHDAYRTLGYFERCVLVALAAEYRGGNNGGLALTYAQARDRYGLRSKNRFYDALKELEWRGLIRRTWAARLRQYSDGPSRYLIEWQEIDELPQYNCLGGPATENWTRWTPDRPRHPRKPTKKKKPLPTHGDSKPSTVPTRGDGESSTVPTDGAGKAKSPYPPVGNLLDICPGGTQRPPHPPEHARVSEGAPEPALPWAARPTIGPSDPSGGTAGTIGDPCSCLPLGPTVKPRGVRHRVG